MIKSSFCILAFGKALLSNNILQILSTSPSISMPSSVLDSEIGFWFFEKIPDIIEISLNTPIIYAKFESVSALLIIHPFFSLSYKYRIRAALFPFFFHVNFLLSLVDMGITPHIPTQNRTCAINAYGFSLYIFTLYL